MCAGARRGIVPCVKKRTLDPDVAVKHLDRLYAAARALARDPWLAEDLVHDVYATTLSRPRMLRGDDELAYLMRALHNRYKDHWRAAKRRPSEQPADEAYDATVPSAGPDLVLEHAETLAAVHRLDSPYREAVVAVDVLGLSYSQAAQALGSPIGTIMSRLHRARERVTAELGSVARAAVAV
jgi:RNA polymerase sigma-70 factor, ECF subfamily